MTSTNEANRPGRSEAREQGEPLLALVLRVCEARGWSLHWTHRSAYLHLEAAELAEAVRGKRGDKLSEAADVLCTLLALSQCDLADIAEAARAKMTAMLDKPRYKGEEFAAPPQPGEPLETQVLPDASEQTMTGPPDYKLSKMQATEAPNEQLPASLQEHIRAKQFAVESAARAKQQPAAPPAIEAVEAFGREMESVVPQIVSDVAKRQAIAAEARTRVMQPSEPPAGGEVSDMLAEIKRRWSPEVDGDITDTDIEWLIEQVEKRAAGGEGERPDAADFSVGKSLVQQLHQRGMGLNALWLERMLKSRADAAEQALAELRRERDEAAATIKHHYEKWQDWRKKCGDAENARQQLHGQLTEVRTQLAAAAERERGLRVALQRVIDWPIDSRGSVKPDVCVMARDALQPAGEPGDVSGG